MADFSTRSRYLPCASCLAPVQVPDGGGAAACAACRTPLSAPPRPDTAVRQSAGGDEGRRLQGLRAQDGRPLLPPAGLEQLVEGGVIPPWKLAEAGQVWSGLRQQLLAQPGDISAAERLVFLTMLFVNTLHPAGEEAKLRGLLEGALEALTLPRHRQVMRGYLSRYAVKLGDTASGEGWLAGCDRGSEDLQTDSTWRISRAWLDTALERHRQVLEVLGESERDVPIMDAMDPIANVLRANSLEKLGRAEDARALLSRSMGGGGGGMATVEGVVRAMPPAWRVCEATLGGARQAAREQVGARAASGGGEVFGWILLAVGLIPVGVLVNYVIAGQFFAPMAAMLLVPVFVGGWGVRMIRAGRRSRRIAREGLHGRGKVTAATPTGTYINNIPMMRLDLELQVDGHPPRRASVRRLLNPGEGALLVGREVPVLWHPSYPDEVVLEG